MWRCSCGALLDYVYHVIWRCRGCNATHALPPMPPLDIKIRVDSNPFATALRRAQDVTRAFEEAWRND